MGEKKLKITLLLWVCYVGFGFLVFFNLKDEKPLKDKENGFSREKAFLCEFSA